MRRLLGPVALTLCSTLFGTAAHAQFGRGTADWATSGGDAHRSSWVRTDPKISKDSVPKQGFQFLWKMKLDNEPRQLNSLTTGVVLNGYIGYRGFRSLGFVGGSSDNVFGIDTDLSRMEWRKHFSSATQPPAGSLACAGGMTANVTRQITAAFPAAPEDRGGGGGGRGGPARSGVGEPRQGAVTLAALAAAAANQAGRGGAGRGGPGPGGFTRAPIVMHALASDGTLHTMFVSNGDEPAPPLRFLPANANALGLVVVGSVAYAATTQGCGGVADGVWTLDLTSKEVTHWQSDKGGISGSAGPAIGPDGTVYVATTRELVALDPKTLKVKDSYAAGGPEFTSSPVLFQHKEKVLVAASTKDGRIHLLDSTALAPLSKTPARSTAGDFVPGALASWQDSDGTRWVLAPAANVVVAWKLAEQNGALFLQPGWTSRDMVSPLTPMVVNGVVFALSSGEFRSNDSPMTAAQCAQRSSPAVLYALDAATGKELWSSGKTMTSFVHGGGLSGGGGQLYVGTYDGTLYAFGFPIEH